MLQLSNFFGKLSESIIIDIQFLELCKIKDSIKLVEIVLADLEYLDKTEGFSYFCEALDIIANEFYFLDVWPLFSWGKFDQSIQLLIDDVAVVEAYLFLVILERPL